MKPNQYGWIVEVLDDIRQFAIENNLFQLTSAIEVAKTEALNEIDKSNAESYRTLMEAVYPSVLQQGQNIKH